MMVGSDIKKESNRVGRRKRNVKIHITYSHAMKNQVICILTFLLFTLQGINPPDYINDL